MERILCNPAFLLILFGSIVTLALTIRRVVTRPTKSVLSPSPEVVVVSKVFRPGTTRVTRSSITQQPEEWLIVVSSNGGGKRTVSVSRDLWNSVESGDKVFL